MTGKKREWPASGIVKKPVNLLVPRDSNPRTHASAQIDAVARSIRKWGWTTPVLIDEDGGILAGHGRVLAARKLGIEEIPCLVARGWTDEEKSAYVIADNQLTVAGDWDIDQLRVEVGDLFSHDFDISLLGFPEKELQALLDGSRDEPPDDSVPELSEPETKPGYLYELGRHRILCGDATRASDMRRVMDRQRADLLLTDPPYNVALGGEGSATRNRRTDNLTIQNDDMSDEAFGEFLRQSFRCAFDALRPGAGFYIWYADVESLNFFSALLGIGEQVRQILVWKKQRLVMGRQDYQQQHELCIYGWKKGAAHTWYSDRKQTTILEFDRPFRSKDHPTMKPLKLLAYLLRNSTRDNDVVLDPFLGSGSTLIAAEQLGRICYGLELDPRYVDVIVRRWESLTGGEAKLLGVDADAEELLE